MVCLFIMLEIYEIYELFILAWAVIVKLNNNKDDHRIYD
jgi:hypothetical protein